MTCGGDGGRQLRLRYVNLVTGALFEAGVELRAGYPFAPLAVRASVRFAGAAAVTAQQVEEAAAAAAPAAFGRLTKLARALSTVAARRPAAPPAGGGSINTFCNPLFGSGALVEA